MPECKLKVTLSLLKETYNVCNIYSMYTKELFEWFQSLRVTLRKATVFCLQYLYLICFIETNMKIMCK